MKEEMNSPAIPGKKPRRVRVKYSTNPFLQNVVAKLGDKRVAVSFKPGLAEIDQQTGEITPLQGQITKMISADREGFVKLYTAQIDAFFELGKPGRTVVKYLIWLHQQDANKHLIYLHPDQVAESGLQIGKTTWYDGIVELMDRKIIAASKLPHMYFLNPAVFFNGDRTRFVVEIRKSKKPSHEQLEAAGQQRLLE